ncbi:MULTISPECIES: ATP-binding protein [Streptomyces]|uniref:ATP-binding protein n=1 Tax=Streptomyces glycanivorans TaxID=3033808 RepID=A0ABY9JG04_9ACTN|nr:MULTISPECIES: ATP-binding protein [unclassified Streptomyces]TXS09418.1 ATP-binding protein [Streptomyces sp. wa22]WLQ65899.1 ATP-binding protein [Streptomyces sp. Alt3]WSR49990.1 ATP-binding protein [Streptomyces sp. NBC_01201]
MTTPAQPSGDTFELRFYATPRGARLARRLASHRVHEWGHRYGTEANDTVSLVVGELAANAVTHGLVPGRGALLRLVRPARGSIRVEVSDTRGERWPVPDGSLPGLSRSRSRSRSEAEPGRGLVIVGALAQAWGVVPRDGAPGKTVWAEIDASPAIGAGGGVTPSVRAAGR